MARKREVALRILRGEPVEILSRELGVEIFRLEAWRESGATSLLVSTQQPEALRALAEIAL